jgi:uncharacterized membrane protein YcaP (DUF421 family)
MNFWQGDPDLSIMGFVVRALVAYLFLFGLIKFLGQRTMSNLQAQDFLFAIVIGDVIGEPLVNGDAELAGPAAVAVTLTLIHYVVSYFALKSARFRRLVDEEPIIIVTRGQIIRSSMKSAKVTLDMLLMACRMNNISRLSEVEVAVLEPNGEISILTKANSNPITPADLNMNVTPVTMPSVLIEDGNIVQINLRRNDLSEEWLLNRLNDQGVSSSKDVFVALLESDGSLYISKKNEPYR